MANVVVTLTLDATQDARLTEFATTFNGGSKNDWATENIKLMTKAYYNAWFIGLTRTEREDIVNA